MLLNEKETYAINGICMEVHKELGMGFQENVYKDALELEFKTRNIPYLREAHLPVFYKGIKLRTFNVDFLVYDKIILEIKATSAFTDDNFRQVINYLKCSQLQVGLLVNFGSQSLTFKRFIV